MWADGSAEHIKGQSFASPADWFYHIEEQLRLAQSYASGPAKRSGMSSVQEKVYIAEQWSRRAYHVLEWLRSGSSELPSSRGTEEAKEHITSCLEP